MKRAEAFKWVWDQRILVGYINLIVGEEGVGKGNLAAWIAARITRGDLPGDLLGQPRRVLFVGDEDSWDHIWTPRLAAAGADLTLCSYIVKGVDGGVFDVTEPEDVAALRAYIPKEGIAFMYFDQLFDNLGAVDTWKDKQVRDALAPVKAVAQEAECAMAMSVHPNKRRGSFRDRISGTPAFNALSRSSLLVARHPHDQNRVVMVRAKGNYSQEPPAFEFRIQQFAVNGKGGKSVPTSRIIDTRDSYDIATVDVLDAEPAGRRRTVETQFSKAEAFLQEFLADGEEHDRNEVYEEAKRHKISGDAVKRAAKLHVKGKRTQTYPSRAVWRLR
jgi:hypothetical protein